MSLVLCPPWGALDAPTTFSLLATTFSLTPEKVPRDEKKVAYRDEKVESNNDYWVVSPLEVE